MNKLGCPRGDGTIDGYYNGYFNDGLLSTAVATAVGRSEFNNGLFDGIYYQLIGGLRAPIMNTFLYGVMGYFNCFNTQRERGIVLDTGVPSVTSHNIVLKFLRKKTIFECETKPIKKYDKSLFDYFFEGERERIEIYLEMSCCSLCWFFCQCMS